MVSSSAKVLPLDSISALIEFHISLNSSSTSDGGASNRWALVEPVEQHALDALAGSAGKFGGQPLARGFLQLVERFQTERLGELVVDLGFLRRFDQGCRGFEFGRLTGKLVVGIILRERNFQRAGFARGDADAAVPRSRE